MQRTFKPFEIPYNFDKKLIDFLTIYTSISVHCIYLPPMEIDYSDSAKRYTVRLEGRLGIPNTKEEYEEHIKYINKFFPNKIMLLLQSNRKIMNKLKLKYYISLGITKFCVGTIKQAKLIRQILPTAEITGSITMKIEPEELKKNIKIYRKYFDNFVLWFPYNRDMQKINALPEGFGYVMLINCGCSIICDGTHHWFENSYTTEAKYWMRRCPKELNPEKYGSYKNVIFIKPTHLYLFEDKITYWKLQGRESGTDIIIKDIIMYTTNVDIYRIAEQDDIYETYNIPYPKKEEE